RGEFWRLRSSGRWTQRRENSFPHLEGSHEPGQEKQQQARVHHRKRISRINPNTSDKRSCFLVELEESIEDNSLPREKYVPSERI
ncbi:hypothetical protein AVEN_98266-1, partial [Araneus ventricosus]